MRESIEKKKPSYNLIWSMGMWQLSNIHKIHVHYISLLAYFHEGWVDL